MAARSAPPAGNLYNQTNGKKQLWRGGEAARRHRGIRLFPSRASRRAGCRATSGACPSRSGFCWRICCAMKTASAFPPQDVEAVARGEGAGVKEISFMPARVLLQDFTGVPCVVDLAAMRDALAAMGADPEPRQSAAARRPGDRPLRPGGSLRRRRIPSTSMRCSNSSAIASATSCCAGARRRSAISAWCRPIPASSTR